MVFNGMVQNPYQQQEVTYVVDEQSGEFSSNVDCLVAYAKPRLRWTPELHDQFLKAVNDLGGPNKATPKTVMKKMDVEGLNLYQVKSHLQKFRHGKTAKRCFQKPFVPANFSSKKDVGLTMEAQGSSSIEVPTNIDGLPHENGMKTDPYATLHELNETTSVKSLEVTEKNLSPVTINQEGTSSVTTSAAIPEESLATAKPPLPPLFPSLYIGGVDPHLRYFSEWLELIDGGRPKPVDPRPVQGVPIGGAYDQRNYYSQWLEPLGNSSEFALPKAVNLVGLARNSEAAFEDVASFLDGDVCALAADDNDFA